MSIIWPDISGPADIFVDQCPELDSVKDLFVVINDGFLVYKHTSSSVSTQGTITSCSLNWVEFYGI